MAKRCLCVTISCPIGTVWYVSPDCKMHKGSEDELTWEEIEEALKIAEATKKARRGNAANA
jgi:hypothetical protein